MVPVEVAMSDTANWITFGKDQYYLNREMEEWCTHNVGPGKWISGRLKTWEGMGDTVWVMESMFGNTTFSFRDAKHLTHFLLRWA